MNSTISKFKDCSRFHSSSLDGHISPKTEVLQCYMLNMFFLHVFAVGLQHSIGLTQNCSWEFNLCAVQESSFAIRNHTSVQCV